MITSYELRELNIKRKKKGLRPLAREHVEEVIKRKREDDPNFDIVNFLLVANLVSHQASPSSNDSFSGGGGSFGGGGASGSYDSSPSSSDSSSSSSSFDSSSSSSGGGE